MKPLQLHFFLINNVLFLVVKGKVFSYDLSLYGFDISVAITRGKSKGEYGNNLFHPQAETLIKEMKNVIRSQLTAKERFLYGAFVCGKEGVFISDRPLNNFGVRHFIDFMEQVNVSRMGVYYLHCDAQRDIRQLMREVFENNFRGAFLGKVGRDRKYSFASNDESISQSEGF